MGGTGRCSIDGRIIAKRRLPIRRTTFARSTSFEHGALLAVNLGDDADTTGAVYGQIAGAYYGVEGIPEKWRHTLAALPTLERFALALMNHSR
jgi:ADP-ribosyl-[dinitrogen reductase] hydrolase